MTARDDSCEPNPAPEAGLEKTTPHLRTSASTLANAAGDAAGALVGTQVGLQVSGRF